MYAMALNLSAKDPVTYVVHSLRDKGCLERAAHLVRQYIAFSHLLSPSLQSTIPPHAIKHQSSSYQSHSFARDFLALDSSRFVSGGILAERESFLQTLCATLFIFITPVIPRSFFRLLAGMPSIEALVSHSSACNPADPSST
jgi:hypothetical protein